MAEIGDKFIIEIGSKFYNSANETLYRIKGFNSLVFDENGISKLTPYKEQGDPSFEKNLRVGDQFKLMGTDNTYLIITKIDKPNRRVSVLWRDGNTQSIDIMSLYFTCNKTGINYSDQLDAIFGELPY